MGITFGINDLVNVLHKLIVECVKIYSHFLKNCYKYIWFTYEEYRNITIYLHSKNMNKLNYNYNYTFIYHQNWLTYEDHQGYHRIDHTVFYDILYKDVTVGELSLL